VKFSIVTISFNQAEFLERTILSVLGQKSVDIEYIVVDPGSTDGSREIIERYRDRIEHVVFEKDGGPAEGLNKGFARAGGEWFGYINSDDYYLPGGLARAAAVAQRLNHCAAIVGNGYIVDAQDRILRRSISTKYSMSGALHGACFSLQQATFYRREAFREVGGFNEENRTCWDGEILMEMMKHGRNVARFYNDVGAFRIHSQSITGSGRLNEQYLQDCTTIFEAATGRRRNNSDKLLVGPSLRLWARVRDPRRAIDLAIDRLAHCRRVVS
jgi:glycosyltransferase involved in cell wall biosynthesis